MPKVKQTKARKSGKKYVSSIILIFLLIILNSCTIKLPNSNDDNGNGSNYSIYMHNPHPFNGETEVSLTPFLSWEVISSNTNNLRYDVYLDTAINPEIILQQVYSPNYSVQIPLANNKTYYWKIRGICDHGDSTSETWSFTTISGGLPINGLAAYYPFNGNANDESGNGNTGNVVGAVLTNDRFNYSNKAYLFDGINSYIWAQHSSWLQPSAGITISAWFYFNSHSNTGTIIAKGPDSLPGWYSLRYEATTGTMDFQINFADYTGGPKKTVSISPVLNDYTWYNIIGTYDGSYMKVYFNGQIYGSMPVGSSLGSNYDGLVIGSSFNGYMFNGSLDDIRIYNRALSEGEVQQLYHEGGWQMNKNDNPKQRGKIK